ncbi:hypothetical protein FXB39_05450 [Nocardioides sp. BGMRC 2183]|nr:hypothetical protein FXB39_05450 [Nocardioides sp. BGMRC 2183]
MSEDDELFAALGEAVAARADDDRRRAAAKAAFTWRTVDAELAELLHDSALDAGAAVRSVAAAPRTLSFGRRHDQDSVTLELEITDGDLLGQVIGEAIGTTQPGATTTVTVQRPGDADVEVAVDAGGFFTVPGVGTGPVRFRVQGAGAGMTTDWITL